jgi:hypothetical protein
MQWPRSLSGSAQERPAWIGIILAATRVCLEGEPRAALCCTGSSAGQLLLSGGLRELPAVDSGAAADV